MMDVLVLAVTARLWSDRGVRNGSFYLLSFSLVPLLLADALYGLIQLTGRANYREYGRAISREAELLANPELLETDPDLCVDVAGWFWAKRNLNTLADADDLTRITKRINGGLNGLEDRRRLLKRAKALLSL